MPRVALLRTGFQRVTGESLIINIPMSISIINSIYFQSNFENHLRTLSEMIYDGNTVARVDNLIKEAKLFHKLCQSDLDRAEEVISCGVQLIHKAACPKEVVQPKCDELSRIRNLITDRLNKRHEILLKSRDLMDRVEKVIWMKKCAK